MDTAGGVQPAEAGWDFYVSYAAADQAWAEWVAWELEAAGYRVLFQAWDFVPGSHWTNRMQEGVVGAERTVAILSYAYLDSVYGRAEWQAAYRADPRGFTRKLIPVRVEDCDRPGLLGEVVSVDLFDCPADAARQRFLGKILEALAGSAKPPRAPGFPGRPHGAGEVAATVTVTGAASNWPVAARPRRPRTWGVDLERNAGFVGRGEILDSLRAGFSNGSGGPLSPVRRILCGMSGAGKTEIAVEYAYRTADSYDVALLVRGGSKDAVSASYVGLAGPLGLSGHADVKRVRDALDRTDGLLLIFDDVDAGHLGGLLPRRGHVLITTRSRTWPDTKNLLTVGTFTRHESIQMIVDRLPASGRRDADGLAADLGDLPVALDHVLRNARGTGRSVAKVREVLADDPGVVTRGAPDRSRPAGEFWQREIAYLAGDEPAAACLLRMVALLAPGWDVPHALFEANPALLPDELRVGAGPGAAGLDRALAPAVSTSWFVRTSPDSVAMHEVVALSVQQGTSASQRRRLRRSLVSLLHESALGSRAAIGRCPEVWAWWAEMLPHVLILVDHAETAEAVASLPDGGAELARKVADLAGRSATFLYAIGSWGRAVELHRRALAVLVHLDGPDSVSAAEALRNLAGALLACGAVAAAVDAAKQVVSIDEKHYEPTDSVVATDLRLLACALLEADDVDGAARHAVRSLEVETGRVLVRDDAAAIDTAAIDTAIVEIAADGVDNLLRPGVRVDAVADSVGLLGTIARRSGDTASASTFLEAATRWDEQHREGRRPRPVEVDRLFQLAELAREQRDETKTATSDATARRLAEEIFSRDGPLPAHDLPRRRATLPAPAQRKHR